MATTTDPLSTSFRTSQTAPPPAPPSYISYSESPLTQLPQPQFDFDDLRKRMTEFTLKFDAFIDRGRKRVLEERNAFKTRVAEVNEQSTSTQTHIATLQSTLTHHTSLHARTLAERTAIQSEISSLSTHSSTLQSRRDKLQAQIASTQRQIDARLKAQREYEEKQDTQRAQNGPELAFWERYLGVSVDGAGEEGRIRVKYVFPGNGKLASGAEDGSDEVEAEFELWVPEGRGEGYSVTYVKPSVDEERVKGLVGRLNETRDFAGLLKGMRGLFGEVLREGMVVR